MKPRTWTLRISSADDGSGYIYSGDDVSYPEDDYVEVAELSSVKDTLKVLKNIVDLMKGATKIAPMTDAMVLKLAEDELKKWKKVK